MEISASSKHLARHAVPVLMVAGVLIALSAVLPSRYNAGSLDTEAAIARGAVTPFVHLTVTPNGSVKLTVGDRTADSSPAAGSVLGDGVAAAGRDVQLSFNLQAPAE